MRRGTRKCKSCPPPTGCCAWLQLLTLLRRSCYGTASGWRRPGNTGCRQFPRFRPSRAERWSAFEDRSPGPGVSGTVVPQSGARAEIEREREGERERERQRSRIAARLPRMPCCAPYHVPRTALTSSACSSLPPAFAKISAKKRERFLIPHRTAHGTGRTHQTARQAGA